MLKNKVIYIYIYIMAGFSPLLSTTEDSLCMLTMMYE